MSYVVSRLESGLTRDPSTHEHPPKLAFLDGLRGLAAFYVMVGHARWLLWEVSVRWSAVGGGANLARTLRSVDRRGGRFGDGGGGLTRGLPRRREHGRHIAQAHAAREARQDAGQLRLAAARNDAAPGLVQAGRDAQVLKSAGTEDRFCYTF